MAQTDRLAEQKLEFEKEKLKSETKLKEQKIDVQEKAQNDEIKLIKRYGDALAQVISLQPKEVTDLPAYFRGVEEQFNKVNVPRKYEAQLIYKYLSAWARMGRMTAAFHYNHLLPVFSEIKLYVCELVYFLTITFFGINNSGASHCYRPICYKSVPNVHS